jgi:hypothetical protein
MIKIISKKFFAEVLVTLLLLLMYVLILSWLLPEGINSAFVSKTLKLLAAGSLMVFLSGIFFVRPSQCREAQPLLKRMEKADYRDLILLLFPMTPIFQYVLSNQDILNTSNSLIILLFFLCITFCVSFVVPWLLSCIGSKSTLMLMSLSLTFIIFNMSILASSFAWHLSGAFGIQFSLFILVFVFLHLLYSREKTFAYFAVCVFFLGNSILSLMHVRDESATTHPRVGSPEYHAAIENQMRRTPHIFLLMYESYSNQETMMQYGFDNSEHIEYLKENGFAIYPGTYSVAYYTMASISRLFELGSEQPGNRRSLIAGDGAVYQILRNNGYLTAGIFKTDYFFRGIKPSYDIYYPHSQKPYRLLIHAIAEGEFRFDIGFTIIDHLDYLAKKRNFFAQKHRKPVFLYTHSSFPGHSQNSGQCRIDETALHINGIRAANEEMEDDIGLILASHPDAIIIVAGDHGPHLTKNCTNLHLDTYDRMEIDRLDIQDRYGAFLAIRWSNQNGAEKKFDIEILQDIFPAVLSYLYEEPSLFGLLRQDRKTIGKAAGGVHVKDGIIIGGKNHGEPLFLEEKQGHAE